MDVGFCIKEAEYALRHMHHWMKAEREPTPLLLELGLKLSMSWRSTRSRRMARRAPGEPPKAEPGADAGPAAPP